MADVVEKMQSSKCVGKLLFALYLENTLFKDKFRHPFSELDLGTCEYFDAWGANGQFLTRLGKFPYFFKSKSKKWHSSHERRPSCVKWFAMSLNSHSIETLTVLMDLL